MKKILSIAIIFLTGCFTNISHAESTGYEVEIIIFSYLNDKYETSENWPLNTAKIAHDIHQAQTETETIIEIDDVANNTIIDASTTEENLITATDILLDSPDPITQKPIDLNMEAEFLSPKHYRLNKEANKIKKNPKYNFLIHLAWKQAGLPSEKAFPIYLKQMAAMPENIDTLNQQGQSPSLLYPNRLIEVHKQTEYLEGEIKLVMSRYLHISSKLILHTFNQQNIENNNDLEKERSYEITLDRRMKSKEINFIDHPLIGLLVIATPFIIPDEEQDKQETTPIYKTIN